MLFKPKEKINLQEGTKLVGNQTVRKAIKYEDAKTCFLKNELGEKTVSCQKLFEEMGVENID